VLPVVETVSLDLASRRIGEIGERGSQSLERRRETGGELEHLSVVALVLEGAIHRR
jgi:hypothetical protein